MATPHCFRKYDAIIRMQYYMSGENTELSDDLKAPLTSFRSMTLASYESIMR